MNKIMSFIFSGQVFCLMYEVKVSNELAKFIYTSLEKFDKLGEISADVELDAIIIHMNMRVWRKCGRAKIYDHHDYF